MSSIRICSQSLALGQGHGAIRVGAKTFGTVQECLNLVGSQPNLIHLLHLLRPHSDMKFAQLAQTVWGGGYITCFGGYQLA